MTAAEGRQCPAQILGLGHVGLFVGDLAASVQFWTEVLDMTVTDGSVESGTVFLSADPQVEHHMLLLRSGRSGGPEVQVVQQVSFRCRTLEGVAAYRRRLHNTGVATMDVSHGNAVGVYFHDPDGNVCEVYWQTGLAAVQVFKQWIDLDQPLSIVLDAVGEGVAQYGETGVREAVPFVVGPVSR
jgi:catechol 2,3-dioxygenase-like lactoylglutathione lyase family enzyme